MNVFLGKRARKPKGVAPEFTQPLKPSEIVEGNPIRLKCRMIGTPEPMAEWFKDSLSLALSKRIKADVIGDMCQLSFTQAQIEDSGLYKCVIRNDLGSASSECSLLVTKPTTAPEVKGKMRNVRVTEGEQARFNVRVSGNPKPDVRWFCGTQEITNEGRFTTLAGEEEQYSLLIEETTLNDAGAYKCVASNAVGRATSRAELEVSEKHTAPEFVGELDEAPISAKEGEEISLEVTIRGKPSPDVQWYKDELNVRKSSYLNVLVKGNKHSLVIYSVKPTDAGVYKCAAKSKMGSITRTFRINIEREFILISVRFVKWNLLRARYGSIFRK